MIPKYFGGYFFGNQFVAGIMILVGNSRINGFSILNFNIKGKTWNYARRIGLKSIRSFSNQNDSDVVLNFSEIEGIWKASR